jgi:hypothetical protein
MKKMLNEGNQIQNFMSSSGSGSVINYGSGSDFLTSYSSGSGSKSQKVTVPTVPVPVPQHWFYDFIEREKKETCGEILNERLKSFSTITGLPWISSGIGSGQPCTGIQNHSKIRQAQPFFSRPSTYWLQQ